MSSFRLNDSEEELLLDEPSHLYKMYTGIRKHMDYKTGISGEERRLSEDYFIERLSYSSRQGRKGYKCPREKIRSGLRILEKIGLIKRLNVYVFLCVLADRDESVQNVYNRFTTRTQPKKTEKNPTQPFENKDILESYPHGLQPYYSARCNPLPVPDNNIKNTYVQTPENGLVQKPKKPDVHLGVDDEVFMKFWTAYPKKQKRKGAYKIWKDRKLSKVVDKILQDVSQRRLTQDWMKEGGQFIPLPTSYLNQERWHDESKGIMTPQQEIEVEMPTAEEAYLTYTIYGPGNPNSFTADVISCIPGFRRLGPSDARSEFLRAYSQRKPIYVERCLKNQNRGCL